jgi:hypothetical protein
LLVAKLLYTTALLLCNCYRETIALPLPPPLPPRSASTVVCDVAALKLSSISLYDEAAPDVTLQQQQQHQQQHENSTLTEAAAPTPPLPPPLPPPLALTAEHNGHASDDSATVLAVNSVSDKDNSVTAEAGDAVNGTTDGVAAVKFDSEDLLPVLQVTVHTSSSGDAAAVAAAATVPTAAAVEQPDTATAGAAAAEAPIIATTVSEAAQATAVPAAAAVPAPPATAAVTAAAAAPVTVAAGAAEVAAALFRVLADQPVRRVVTLQSAAAALHELGVTALLVAQEGNSSGRSSRSAAAEAGQLKTLLLQAQAAAAAVLLEGTARWSVDQVCSTPAIATLVLCTLGALLAVFRQVLADVLAVSVAVAASLLHEAENV